MPKQPTGKTRKAKPKKQSNARQPAWPRMVNHLAQVISQSGSREPAAIDTEEREFAAIDLENELKSGKRKSMRRNIKTLKKEILSSAYWEKRQIALVYLLEEKRWAAWVYQRQGSRWGGWHPQDRDDDHVYYVSPDLERRGRGPRFTDKQLAELQAEYRAYKKAKQIFKKDDANAHLQKFAKSKFGITAHTDTIRDHVMTPVDDADALVEK